MTPFRRSTKGHSGSARIDWEEVVQLNASWLRTVVFSRLQDPAALDDVMQEVGLAIARQRQRPEAPEQVRPWLYRVAVRQCLMHRRGAGRRRRLTGRLAAHAVDHDGSPDPLEWLLMDERRSAVRAALKELSELDRQILLLKYTENWTYRRMAEALGVSSDTIEYRLLRAKDRLRRQLTRQGVVEATHEA
jgi:RNA polymerase sigma-70 factor (ECF subfamily)